ncbi:hypothetical protein PACTADRAFT_33511 [Pachysolen tannophilus NRRL Y-2460]|uniref:Inositol-pentakisphosphate 2-kinase n=1 Tax=Pachysolen tannophilus NRRL Y-2460 TaxID=669874 RepID=A0A1E4TX80_PACTA|nr:hypothetical protein PACTADRAFT_33511 [Pachysolen tannophilus NRRL Y-2460]
MTTFDAREWVYFSSGNANILLKYVGNSDPNLTKKLLRLKRVGNKNCDERIKSDLLKDYFLHSKCIELSSKFLLDLNHKLIKTNPELAVPASTNGEILLISIFARNHGILMPNLLNEVNNTVHLGNHLKVHYGDSELVLEMKPKWLYNLKTRNCRNCCLSKYRGKQIINCPLDLLCENKIPNWSKRIVQKLRDSEHSINYINSLELILTEFFMKNKIIGYLFMLQNRYYDSSRESYNRRILNLKSADEVPIELIESQTLRDVTLFLNIHSLSRNNYDIVKDTVDKPKTLISINNDSFFEVDCKLIDLDLKTSLKFEYWKETELKLIESGLYTSDKYGLVGCNRIVDII